MSDQLNFESFVDHPLVTKQFVDHNLRIIDHNGEPWFVAKDICEILDISNSRDAISGLDDDEKFVSVLPTPAGNREMTVVNEPGLYGLIFKSRKKEANNFKRWIKNEVLPSIRKTGEYSIFNPPKLPNFNDPVAAARAWADAKEAELKANLELIEAAPKIEFYDELKDSKGLYSVGDAAKLLGTGRNRLFDLFRINNIFMGIVPYQRYIEDGYFKVKADSVNDHVQKQAFITPKGLQWLKKRFFK